VNEDVEQMSHFEAQTEVLRLREAIRLHRDERGHDRCWLDDMRLYAVLGENSGDQTLPPKCEFLTNCEIYWLERQPKTQETWRSWLGLIFSGFYLRRFFWRLTRRTN
jgi:hypothetical protein